MMASAQNYELNAVLQGVGIGQLHTVGKSYF